MSYPIVGRWLYRLHVCDPIYKGLQTCKRCIQELKHARCVLENTQLLIAIRLRNLHVSIKKKLPYPAPNYLLFCNLVLTSTRSELTMGDTEYEKPNNNEVFEGMTFYLRESLEPVIILGSEGKNKDFLKIQHQTSGKIDLVPFYYLLKRK